MFYLCYSKSPVYSLALRFLFLFWELSRLCPETSIKLYVHEFGFRSCIIIQATYNIRILTSHCWSSSNTFPLFEILLTNNIATPYFLIINNTCNSFFSKHVNIHYPLFCSSVTWKVIIHLIKISPILIIVG